MTAETLDMAPVDAVLKKYDYSDSKLIPILQQIQEHFRYLPEETIAYVAKELKIPAAKVYGVATFYAHFALEPKGKYVFKICDGTACHVKGSTKIIDALYKKVGLSAEKSTTDDQLFTIETVSCLGACGLAPVMLMNEDVYGQVKAEQAVAIVDELLKAEGK